MQHVQVKHQAVPTSGNGSSLSHLLLHYDDGSSFQAHHGISLTSEQKPPNSPFPTFQQPPFPPPFRWFSIKMMMVTKMMMRYLTTSTRGSFPPGFPGLRLPGLRFHPHFGEPKVIWKYKLSFLILSTTTGWRTLSSRSTSLCTSPWRSGQLQEKLHICCLFSCTPQYLIHYFMLSIYHFAISLFSCKKCIFEVFKAWNIWCKIRLQDKLPFLPGPHTPGGASIWDILKFVTFWKFLHINDKVQQGCLGTWARSIMLK